MKVGKDETNATILSLSKRTFPRALLGARSIQKFDLHVTGSFCISSGGVSVVITQHSAQTFASLNGPHLFTDSSNWNDEPVAKPLVISLEVIMKNEMVNRQT